ncbi:MAG: biotin--[acetyl-CoA-carboxylase] ligase [Dehalococcoidia bacterium]|nr:biotin--[acetyl-CoA-carboxylase] ligase [Dehalococcoidia bacterium]
MVTSTMDIARQEAERGAAEGTVVVAEEQTAGRGRFGRQWRSTPRQNLSFSVLLYPSRRTSTRLSSMTPVAVLRAIRTVTGLTATLKWPNDVRLGEKKVCGILVEADFQDSQVRHAILGIGINVNLNPADDPQAYFVATSLAAELGKPVSREELLQAILTELGLAYTHLKEWNRVWDEWCSSLETLGRQVQVRWGDHVEEGVAEDVDSEGNLLLRRADGTLVALAAGEVTFQL